MEDIALKIKEELKEQIANVKVVSQSKELEEEFKYAEVSHIYNKSFSQ